MSPAHVHEPTYRRLKGAILKGGWPMGTKLEAMRLADDFGVSMTPVRDSLNRLVGEGLVDLNPGEGFRVAAVNEQRLRDILKVNLVLLEYALRPGWALVQNGTLHLTDQSYSTRVGAVFATVVEGANNSFLAESVLRISERLHLIRELELEIVPEASSLLSMMERSLKTTHTELRDVIARYHDASLQNVPQLIAATTL